MSHLSPVEESARRLISQIERVRLGKRAGRYRPHKLVMLLTVANMFEAEALRANRIYFDDDLKQTYKKLFEQYRQGDDWNQPAPPFFHLRSADFWNHKVKDGKELSYSLLTTSGGGEKRIREHIDYAFLSHEVFIAFSHPESRKVIIGAITDRLEQL